MRPPGAFKRQVQRNGSPPRRALLAAAGLPLFPIAVCRPPPPFFFSFSSFLFPGSTSPGKGGVGQAGRRARRAARGNGAGAAPATLPPGAGKRSGSAAELRVPLEPPLSPGARCPPPQPAGCRDPRPPPCSVSSRIPPAMWGGTAFKNGQCCCSEQPAQVPIVFTIRCACVTSKHVRQNSVRGAESSQS